MPVAYELNPKARSLAVRRTIFDTTQLPLIIHIRDSVQMASVDVELRLKDMDTTSQAIKNAINHGLVLVGASIFERIRTAQRLNAVLGGPLSEDHQQDIFINYSLPDKTSAVNNLIHLLAANLANEIFSAYRIRRHSFEDLDTGHVVVREAVLRDKNHVQVGGPSRVIKISSINKAEGKFTDNDNFVITPNPNDSFVSIDDARDIAKSVNHALSMGGCLLDLAGRLKYLHKSYLEL